MQSIVSELGGFPVQAQEQARMRIHHWSQIREKYEGGTLLLGNGASIAVSERLRYQSLLKEARGAGKIDDQILSIFDFLNTKDFEFVLRTLWQTYNINNALRVAEERTPQAYTKLRRALIEIVREHHPSHSEVVAQLPNIHRFLSNFSTVLSLNYDLIVYWAVMHGFSSQNARNMKDCFVHGRFDSNWARFRESSVADGVRQTLVFYLHGNLALGVDSSGAEKKIQASESGLLDAIFKDWERALTVPIFVSEGDSRSKVASIQRSYYLSTVYHEVMSEPGEAIVVFGWGMSDQDDHILQRFAGKGVKYLAVSVHESDEDYCNFVFRKVRRALGDVNVEFFDSRSKDCWNG